MPAPANCFIKNKILLLVLALILALQSGCTVPDSIFGFWGKDKGLGMEGPEGLVMKGLDEFNHGKYNKALKIFEDVKNRFPFSSHSLLAELKAADSQYYLKEYPEALLLYEEYEERHPTNEAIPYIIFQIGMCYYRQIDTIDRDTTGAAKAVQAFTRLLRTFPDTPYTVEARARVQAAQNFLANHEFYVATFYLRTKSYKEAEARLDELVALYPETEIAPKAEQLVADLRAGNPPRSSWTSWIPDLSLPDWRFFTGLRPGATSSTE